MEINWIEPLAGGGVIGLSVSLFYWGMGRIAGVSGIFGGLLAARTRAETWRLSFVGGLVVGGALLGVFWPETLEGQLNVPPGLLILAGLFVGFGTRMGGGCTSGHGVCGISRFSVRSLCATLTFIVAGVLTVVCVRAVGGLL